MNPIEEIIEDLTNLETTLLSPTSRNQDGERDYLSREVIVSLVQDIKRKTESLKEKIK